MFFHRILFSMNYFCYLRLKARSILPYINFKVNNFLKYFLEYFLEYFRNKVKSMFQDGWLRALTLGRAAHLGGRCARKGATSWLGGDCFSFCCFLLPASGFKLSRPAANSYQPKAYCNIPYTCFVLNNALLQASSFRLQALSASSQ